MDRPAYSAPFAPDALPTLPRIPRLEEITPEWAWGDSADGAGKGVRVAVVDSGIEGEHPAVGGVQGNVAVAEGPEGFVYDREPHGDTCGHGTACAGIIRSLAPECELYSIQVLGAGLTGRGPIFAAGLRWAIENGMHVCNLSLGTTKREFYATFHELTDLAYFRNVVLVTAANNMPVPSFPCIYASVVSVASHDVPDPYCFFYNPEPPVEFGAFGINVRVPWRDGEWRTVTGNSFAAPHITGLVAALLARHGGLTGFQVKAILRALAANVRRELPEESTA